MRSRPILALASSIGVIALCLASCTTTATDVQLQIAMTEACASGPKLLIQTGTPDDIETQPVKVVSTLCEAGGDLGTLTLVPPDGNDNASLAVRITMAIGGRDPASCTPTDAANCFRQLRELEFVKHKALDLPIHFFVTCKTNLCGPHMTCGANGACITAKISNPSRCATEACFPDGDTDDDSIDPRNGDASPPLDDAQTRSDGNPANIDGSDAPSDPDAPDANQSETTADVIDDKLTQAEVGLDVDIAMNKELP